MLKRLQNKIRVCVLLLALMPVVAQAMVTTHEAPKGMPIRHSLSIEVEPGRPSVPPLNAPRNAPPVFVGETQMRTLHAANLAVALLIEMDADSTIQEQIHAKYPALNSSELKEFTRLNKAARMRDEVKSLFEAELADLIYADSDIERFFQYCHERFLTKKRLEGPSCENKERLERANRPHLALEKSSSKHCCTIL